MSQIIWPPFLQWAGRRITQEQLNKILKNILELLSFNQLIKLKAMFRFGVANTLHLHKFF